MSDKTYRLMPLDWKLIRDNPKDGTWWTASTVFGSIDVEVSPWSQCHWRYCFDEYYDEASQTCESIEAGKAEAEAFYLTRILPAVELIGVHP